MKNREVRLKNYPDGLPARNCFEVVEAEIAPLSQGQMLIRNVWMSVDPYMRGRMNPGRQSYVPPFELGKVMDGGAVGQVVESRGGAFAVGDYVTGMLGGWRAYNVSSGAGLTKIDPRINVPLSAYMGVMGMPGITAWYGLLKIGKPKAGETVFVSAAAGAVGALVCGIAKLKECRVVGTAGSAGKCNWLKDTVGVDAAIDYHTAGDGLTKALRDAAPKGVDVYFDNVGGAHLESALEVMNPNGRIVACGMISQYNNPDQTGVRNLFNIIGKRILMQGFIVSDSFSEMPAFIAEMGAWVAAGKIKWEETVYEGLEKSPEAFIGLFSGDNLGKALVRIGPDKA
ncbi:MAG: NADP-dependent oxidoreductase [Alphaproteobacteria bacterium]|nr:NADP-dependent oxidoreductase [Alphaproteobacteria bacterium]